METATPKKQHYDGLDGLRTFAALGILILHVETNGNFGFDGFFHTQVIPALGWPVFLFMMISGFSLCCGYYDSFRQGTITPNRFYSKRFAKIWPFFALLTLLDVVISPSIQAAGEAFANLTLCFGLLPNPNISVIGVGWTLGVIFVFYLLFPFFCFLLESKKRAWLSFALALVFRYICRGYFFDEAHVVAGFSGKQNILYCGIYFLAGGLIYLYREPLARLRWPAAVLSVAGVAAYFLVGSHTLVLLITFTAMIVYAIGCADRRGVLNNPVTHFISGISMEIYLSHMVIFRVLEKLNLIHRFGAASFPVTVVLTAVGTVIFSASAKWCLAWIAKEIQRRFPAHD